MGAGAGDGGSAGAGGFVAELQCFNPDQRLQETSMVDTSEVVWESDGD